MLRAQDVHTGERAPGHAHAPPPPDTPHTVTAGNARTTAMKPQSHPRLKYLFVVSFGTTMLDLFVSWSTISTNLAFFLSLLIHILALLSITSFVRLVLVFYVATTLRYYED